MSIEIDGDRRDVTPSQLAALVLGGLAIVGLLSLVIGIATREPLGETVRAPVRAVVTITPSDGGASVDAGLVPTSSIDGGPYELDGRSRVAVPDAGCPEVVLIDRVGEGAPWRPALRIHAAFEPSVRALEDVIAESARDVYGREPTRLLSGSSYRCTTVRRRPERISEHALGNAIDLRGIELARADGTNETITVGDHWTATEGQGVMHARFFRLVVTRALERGIFRGVIGPPARDHHDHLHFDRGPSSFVDVDLR